MKMLTSKNEELTSHESFCFSTNGGLNQSLPCQRKNKYQFGHPNRRLLSTNNGFEHPHIDLSSQERGLRPLKTVVLSSKHGDLTVAINQHVPGQFLRDFFSITRVMPENRASQNFMGYFFYPLVN